MTAPIGLVLFAVAINCVGSRWLRAAHWVDRAPALGIAVWQVLMASVLMALGLAGLAVALPLSPGTARLSSLLEACSSVLKDHYTTPGGIGFSVFGAVVTIVALSRILYCSGVEIRTIKRGRGYQRRCLSLSAFRDEEWDFLVLDHSTPAVYCVPGLPSGVVVTSGARAKLSDEQLRAVVAHEHAHLDEHHDVVLASVGALYRALPHLACVKFGHLEMTRLVEMRADDIALRASDRITLARALVNLAQGDTPAGALGAGGAALARLHRLMKPRRPISWGARLLAGSAAVALLVIPMMLVAEPAAVVAMMHYCPIDI
ncbi:M56 family metallopeptidase [soil metagenome]